jgi:hypothetical protein
MLYEDGNLSRSGIPGIFRMRGSWFQLANVSKEAMNVSLTDACTRT